MLRYAHSFTHPRNGLREPQPPLPPRPPSGAPPSSPSLPGAIRSSPPLLGRRRRPPSRPTTSHLDPHQPPLRNPPPRYDQPLRPPRPAHPGRTYDLLPIPNPKQLSGCLQSNQLPSWCSGEDTVMAYELDAKPDRCRCDPPVSVMNLVAEGVAGPNTVVADRRAYRRHLVVGFDQREPR
jgi:hypothetical protein